MTIVKTDTNCKVGDLLKSLTGKGKTPNLQGIIQAGINPLETRKSNAQLGIYPGFFVSQ